MLSGALQQLAPCLKYQDARVRGNHNTSDGVMYHSSIGTDVSVRNHRIQENRTDIHVKFFHSRVKKRTFLFYIVERADFVG